MPNTECGNKKVKIDNVEKTITLEEFMDTTARVTTEEMGGLIKSDPSLLLAFALYSALVAERIFNI